MLLSYDTECVLQQIFEWEFNYRFSLAPQLGACSVKQHLHLTVLLYLQLS